MSSTTTTPNSNITLPQRNLNFGNVDYAIFIFLLSISTGIGVYFGFIAKSKNTTNEYLMGGRKMQVIPIAISLMASQISAITMMTTPAEIYAFGCNYIFNGLTLSVGIVFIAIVVLPVFYNNNISTCYEYLELRFNSTIRKIMTLVFITTYLFLLPVFNYMPSLAFSQVTNGSPHVINAIVNSICIFYTMIGGIRAIIWTDVIQGLIMVGTIMFVAFMAIGKIGGVSEVLRIAHEGHRLDVDLTLDFETRTTIWNSILLSFVFHTSYMAFNQIWVQRLISLPTLEQSKRSIMFYGFFYVSVILVVCFTGIVMYAFYHDCDPVLAGLVKKHDSLIPHFVQEVVGHLKGVPGLFISGIFSAALSTVSAVMNSLAGVIYFDYIKPFVKSSDQKGNFIMKACILVMGIYGILGGHLVEKFGSIVQIIYTFDGVAFGSVFGVFTLGMLMPRAHSKAILWAIIASLVTTSTLVLLSYNRVHYTPLPTSVDGCSANLSQVLRSNTTLPQRNPAGFNILKMSFNWYNVMGALVVFVVGIPLSYILPSESKAQTNRKLLSPVIYPYVEYQLTQLEMKNDEN